MIGLKYCTLLKLLILTKPNKDQSSQIRCLISKIQIGDLVGEAGLQLLGEDRRRGLLHGLRYRVEGHIRSGIHQ